MGETGRSLSKKARKYSYHKTNQMHQFLKFIFGIKLYMLQTEELSETCRVLFQK